VFIICVGANVWLGEDVGTCEVTCVDAVFIIGACAVQPDKIAIIRITAIKPDQGFFIAISLQFFQFLQS
jgi:hypothetical protein